MIEIYVKNIQAIEEYKFSFPEKGIVQFRGNNSNGKSILGKVLSRIVLQQLKYDDKRLPLINDAVEQATVTMFYNKKTLVVQLDKDVNKTFYCIIREDGEKVLRFVREGGITEILREFGWVVYSNNMLCLQICETFGLMPFVNTPDTLNEEVVRSVITDMPCEIFVENYKTTYKEAKAQLKIRQAELKSVQNQLANTKLTDTTGYAEQIKKCREIIRMGNMIKRHKHVMLEPFPDCRPTARRFPHVEIPQFPQPMRHFELLPNLDYLLADMRKLRDGKCPTCGRQWVDCKKLGVAHDS